MSAVDFDPFAGGEILRVSPTTGPQKEIIASAQMSDEANTAFNEAVSLDISGSLDAGLLEECFRRLIQRHDILRATFSRSGSEICLGESNYFSLRQVNLESLEQKEQDQEIEDLCRNIAISPMNLEEGPLFFAWLLRLSGSRHRLLIAAHHLICDGWSFGMLLNELATLYNANADESELPAAGSFFDFAEENESKQVANIDNDYWIDSFRKSSPDTLDLPLDYIRPTSRTFKAARFDYDLNAELTSRLPRAAAAMKASLVNTVMAGYFALLQRLTGNTDIIVGLPVAGQSALNRPNQLGHMVQLLPIRIVFDQDTPFGELVNKVKSEVLNASEHPDFTFGKLLENLVFDRSRVPLISTIFNIDQQMPDLHFGEAVASVRSVPRSAENFEIFLNVVPGKGSLTIEATYSTALFSEATIEAWLKALETLLEQVVDAPETAVGKLCLSAGLPGIVEETNNTDLELAHGDLVSAFRAQAGSTPDAVATVSGEDSLTYAELDDKSDRFAHLLLGRGVTRGGVVGICCRRSVDMLVSCLAVLKAGAAYLPLDPEFPQDRLTFMLEDSAAMAVIEDDSAPGGVKQADIVHIEIGDDLAGGDDSPSLPDSTPDPQQLAYIIYTSGSTGKPKGVCIPNRAVANLLQGIQQRIGIEPGDRLLAVTTLSFDISVLELFLPLIAGGTTVIAAKEEVKDGEQLAALIERHEISMMQATPATWRLLLASDWAASARSAVHKIRALCGGESLPPDLVTDLLPLVSELWNMYGPTETTVWSSCKKIVDPEALISVGKPLANTRIYVLDEDLEPLPVSAPGEICIGGHGVAIGYHNRPDLNAERFVDHPRLGRIYRTGDLGKVLPSGEIHHLGRSDDQVKLRGFRIELGEIEAVIADCPEVESAAVFLWTPAPEDVRIVACCVPAGGDNLETVKIRKQVRERLPQYMVPQYIQAVEALPLTPNGKVDRKALPRPEIAETTILSQSTLVNDTERTIARIWTELVHPRSAIGRDDNFFELGGHSLLALEAIRKIESQTGKRFKPAEIISKRLYTLAEEVNEISEAGNESASGPVALPSQEPRRLSSEQLRILQSQLKNPESTCDNIPMSWILTGDLNLEVFSKALHRVWDRHTALRTRIVDQDGDYRQILIRGDELVLPEIHDFSAQDNPLERAVEHGTQIAATPFEPLKGSLCKVILYQLGNSEYLFYMNCHALTFDGWSIDIMLTELEKTYTAFLQGKTPDLTQLPFEYRDFAQWSSAQPVNAANLEYHKNALREIEPYQGMDIAIRKGHASAKGFKLDEERARHIESFCSQNSIRLHEFFFAAYAMALCELNGERDATIGIPVTGRYTSEVIGIIGSFISVLPCNVHLVGGGALPQVHNIAEQLKEFHLHQDLSFARLVENTAWQNQSFPSCLLTSFAYQDIRNRPVKFGDLKMSQVSIHRGNTRLPIEFWARIESDCIRVVFDFDDAQVSEDLIEKLIAAVARYVDVIDSEDSVTESEPADTGEVPAAAGRSVWRRLFQ
ncbi:MAG: amino acid adenylation domain-containing protein [Gammaproteobacteria bacterium]|jgi:amino acid adenylation domain-containing protein